jgi:hypothetical protein
MTSVGYWIIGIIAIFMFGTLMSARISPREKALISLRDRAKKMGFILRLIPAPQWIQHKTRSGKVGGMVAYYSLILPESTHALVQARLVNSQLIVEKGEPKLQDLVLDSRLKGVFAIEIQSNSVGVFWDEEEDLHAEQLETLKSALLSCANKVYSSF